MRCTVHGARPSWKVSIFAGCGFSGELGLMGLAVLYLCIRVAKTGLGKSVPNNLIFNQVVP